MMSAFGKSCFSIKTKSFLIYIYIWWKFDWKRMWIIIMVRMSKLKYQYSMFVIFLLFYIKNKGIIKGNLYNFIVLFSMVMSVLKTVPKAWRKSQKISNIKALIFEFITLWIDSKQLLEYIESISLDLQIRLNLFSNSLIK